MKKIISIISILAGIVIMHSCTQEDEEPVMAVKNESLKTMAKEGKIGADSINQVQIYQSEVDEGGALEGDPPPKNQGQWRVKD
ncbi:hypothetical protein D3C87_1143290 [compost metagenome]